MAMPSGRKQLLLWVFVSVAVAVAGLVYWQFRTSPPRRALYIVGNAQRGAALFYGDKQCAICHSVNGSGGRVAPDLSGERPSNPAMGWIVTVLWNHGPGMWRQIGQKNGAYPKMDSQEMADILAFLYQASNVDRPGDPTAGERVFSEKGCNHCHAVNSQGGKTAPDLATLPNRGDADAWTSAMLNHAASMVGPITSTLGQWPQLSGNEMNDLIAYVRQGLPKKAGTHEVRGNAEKGWAVIQARCMPCHTVRGQGGNRGPELGPDRDLPLTTAKFASVMWDHAPAMLQRSREAGIAAPQLQGNDMADLRAFLASLRYFEPTGSPLVGERVFSERGCAACHGPRAEGTKMGPPLKATTEAYTAVSFSAALWRHGPRMIDRAERYGLSWPTLKATDIGDLVSFLNAPAPPR